jgi:hypothetical protein
MKRFVDLWRGLVSITILRTAEETSRGLQAAGDVLEGLREGEPHEHMTGMDGGEDQRPQHTSPLVSGST